eukprot:gene4006-4637_t
MSSERTSSTDSLASSASTSPLIDGSVLSANLDEEFEKLLEKLGIVEPNKRKEMLQLPSSHKQMLIDQNKTDIYKTVRSKTNHVQSFADVKSVIASINTKFLTIDVIKTLRVHLNTAPVDWIQSFLNLDGVQPLLDILQMIEKRNRKVRKDLAVLQWECIRCLAAIMKIKIGMDFVASFPLATNLLMLSVDSPLIKVKTMALELLAAVAIIPKGHGAVLTSLIYYKEAKKEEFRYESLVESLKKETNVDYLTTCISFINCIISSPAEVASRIEIRKAFLNLKILKYFDGLRRDFAEDKHLITQLDVFQEELTNDEALNATQTTLVSIDELFSQISARVTGTPSQPELVALMTHFQKMASSSLGLRVWRLYLTLAGQLEEELEAHPEVDVHSISLAFPDHKKGGLFSFGKKGSTSPSLGSQGQDKAKLKRELEEKQSTIKHLLKQLNTFTGGQDVSKWMMEREEKNKMIAQLMAQVKTSDGFAENDQLKRDLASLKMEIEAIRSSPNLGSTIPTISISMAGSGLGGSGLGGSGNGTGSGDDTGSGLGGSGNGIGSLVAQEKNDTPVVEDTSAPPPPPPPGSDCPPPPPPPPGANGAPPPPPPPGSKLANSRPPKPIIKPSVKMRNFNWVTLPPIKVDNTFWDKLDESGVIANLDTNALEGLFSAKAPPPKADTVKSTKKVVVTLIDPKKGNNCAIMLQHFKLGNAELRRIQNVMDEAVLDQQNTQYLLQFVPTREEMDILRDYGGDVSSLGPAEQYMLHIMDIPKLEARLRAHLFRLKMASIVEDLEPDIKAVKQAAMEVKTSKRLHEILRYVLAIGNYVNGSTTRGGAHGFKLDTLSKLRDAKSNDNKMSLLHFLAHTIQQKNPDLWNFASELSHVEHAGEVSLNNIVQDFAEIRKGIEHIQKEFAPASPVEGAPVAAAAPSDKFTQSILSFLATAKGEATKLEKTIEDMNKQFEMVTSYFGENKISCPPDVFFSAFNNFLEDLEKALKEYQTMQKKEKDSKFEDPEKGGLEDLTTHIRSGQLFKERRKSSNLNFALAEKVQLAAASLKPSSNLKSAPKTAPPQVQVTAPSQSLLKPSNARAAKK